MVVHGGTGEIAPYELVIVDSMPTKSSGKIGAWPRWDATLNASEAQSRLPNMDGRTTDRTKALRTVHAMGGLRVESLIESELRAAFAEPIFSNQLQVKTRNEPEHARAFDRLEHP